MFSQIFRESSPFLPLISTFQNSFSLLTDPAHSDYPPPNIGFRYFTHPTPPLDRGTYSTSLSSPVQPFHISYTPFEQMTDTFKNTTKNWWVSAKIAFGAYPKSTHKKKIVIVGTGWASVYFLKNIDVSKYDVTVVSPRNYFVFTPLLPMSVGGTLTYEACIEPIHTFLRRGGKQVMKYHEASVDSIDKQNNIVKCFSHEGMEMAINYDYLVLGVGTAVNTFGIQGVEENCFYFKEVQHARNLKEKVMKNLEKASLPTTSDAEKEKLLHVVVIGAGPSGVEVAAELWDFMTSEGKKHYPEIAPFMKLSIIEMLPNVLPVYNSKVQQFSKEHLTTSGINVKCETAVTKVTPDTISFKTKTKSGPVEVEEPYGTAVWASGVTQTKIGKKIQMSIPEQSSFRFLTADANLKVIGTDNIYAMGDCCMISPPKLAQITDTLYEESQKTPNGAGSTYLSEKAKKELEWNYPQTNKVYYNFDTQPKKDNLSKEDFSKFLVEVDNSFKSPAPTAQNAQQAATYLAHSFNSYIDTNGVNKAPAYVYSSKGKLAYLGKGKAVLELPFTTIAGGFYSGTLWKLAYGYNLLTARSRIKYFDDLIHSSIFGRYTNHEIKTA